MQRSIKKLVDCGILARDALPYLPICLYYNPLRYCDNIKATSTTDIISLRSGISLNQLSVVVL